MTEVMGERYRTLRVGGLGLLGGLIRVVKLVAPQPNEVFSPWQGMQYMRDMFSGRAALHPLENARYPQMRWTSVREVLASRFPHSQGDSSPRGNR